MAVNVIVAEILMLSLHSIGETEVLLLQYFSTFFILIRFQPINSIEKGSIVDAQDKLLNISLTCLYIKVRSPSKKSLLRLVN